MSKCLYWVLFLTVCLCGIAGLCSDFFVWEVARPQRLQYPLIKEYTVNHIRDPTII